MKDYFKIPLGRQSISAFSEQRTMPANVMKVIQAVPETDTYAYRGSYMQDTLPQDHVFPEDMLQAVQDSNTLPNVPYIKVEGTKDFNSVPNDSTHPT